MKPRGKELGRLSAGSGSLLSVASLVFPVAAAGALLIPSNFSAFLAQDGLLFFAGVAGAGRRMFGVPVCSDHKSLVIRSFGFWQRVPGSPVSGGPARGAVIHCAPLFGSTGKPTSGPTTLRQKSVSSWRESGHCRCCAFRMPVPAGWSASTCRPPSLVLRLRPNPV